MNSFHWQIAEADTHTTTAIAANIATRVYGRREMLCRRCARLSRLDRVFTTLCVDVADDNNDDVEAGGDDDKTVHITTSPERMASSLGASPVTL